MAAIVVVAACGAAARRNLRGDATSAVIAANGNASAFEELMSGSVVNGGVWFDDPECMRQFPSAGVIHESQFAAFAKCLATLHLQESPRRAETPDTVILTYEPGFEIEVRTLDTYRGEYLLWIGFVSRYRLADALPTISREALEALRVTGTPNGPLDARVAAALTSELEPRSDPGTAYAWLKVCIDGDGKVSSIRAREASSYSAAEAFAAAARTWQFRPFVSRGKPLPVCSLVLMAEPIANLNELYKSFTPFPRSLGFGENEPPFVGAQIMKRRRIAGKTQIVPDDRTRTAIGRAGIRTVVGAFSLCIDETGHVVRVENDHSTGIPRYDELLTAGIKKWQYKPYLHAGKPVPVCTGVTFVYSQ